MRTIDIHAHLVPESLWRAAEARADWYGFRHEPGAGLGAVLGGGKRTTFSSDKVRFTAEERLRDMDAQGVDGENWDEPKFLPLFKAAEQMGAALFFHPQPQENFMMQRAARHGLSNSLGVIVEDAIVVAVLILGGILDACPGLKVCVAHGGGPACFAMGRFDRGWQRTPAERRSIPQPPSSYQRRLYYDTVVGSEKALRFLLDEVGADRVVLGSDWPFVPWHPSPVAWVQGLKSLTEDEKDRIVSRNLETLLGV